MATTRSQFAQLLAPGLSRVMFEWLKEHPEEYSQFFGEVKGSTRPYEDTQIIAGFGLVPRKEEGAPIVYDDPIQGGTHRVIHDTYALGWQITQEMLEDEQYPIMGKMPKELMKSGRQSWEQIGANLLNLGSSTVTCADGVALFGTHPLLGGGSYTNMLSPGQDFSVTACQDILIKAENMVNERGLKMMLSPTNVWIPPDLQFRVAEVLQTQFQVDSGNNNINTMQGRLTPAVLHFLTSTRNWFVSTKDHNESVFYWRVKPQTEVTDDFETGGVRHKLRYRLSFGIPEWRGWFASIL